MSSNKTVLALVDFSDAHEDVLFAAILHASILDSNLSVYHAIAQSISKESVKDVKDRFEESIKRGCDELHVKVKSHQILIAEEDILTGKLLKQLLTSADFVVMGGGNSRTSDIKREKIIKIVDICPHPVLVIPPQGRINKPERILYCSSFELECNDSLEITKDIAQKFNAEIRLAHVKTHSGSSKENKVERSRFEGKYFGPEVKCEHKLIRNSDVIDGINNYIRKKGDNDLVIMVRRKHHLINRVFGPNFTHKMLQKTEIPLLILKENQLN